MHPHGLREPGHPGPFRGSRWLGIEEGGKVADEIDLLAIRISSRSAGQSRAIPVPLGQTHRVGGGSEPPLLLGDGSDLGAGRDLRPPVTIV